MTDILFGVVAVALVAGTGFAVAVVMRLPDLPRIVLGAYVVGFAEVVGLVLLLSAFQAVTRVAVLGALTTLMVFSAVVLALRGAPCVPAVPQLRVRRGHLLVLGTAAVLAYAYVFALIVGTPPTDYDSLTYHLTRAALWSQESGIHDIQAAYDERLNVHPPNAEIALAFLLEAARHERFAALTQLSAALTSAVAVFAIARNMQFPRREAAFGALLLLTLPIVLLQASTTQNDLIAASLLLAAATFLLGETRREFLLAALATALAVGTKVPAMYGVVILAALALGAHPGRLRIHRIAAVVLGGTVGSYWYVVNLVRSGHALGSLPSTTDVASILEPSANFFAAYARVLDALDLSGSVGADILVYPMVAIAVATVLVIRRLRAETDVLPALTTGALILAPLLFIPLGYALWRVFTKLHDVADEPDGRLPVSEWLAQTDASETLSWFGPLGVPLTVGLGVATIVRVRRGALQRTALVLGAAPLAWFLMLSTTLAYDPWQGRFFIFPVALSASLWGLVLRVPRYATAVVAVAATTAVLSLVHYAAKPSGVRLLDSRVQPTVWRADRWVVQAVQQPTWSEALRFLDEIPPSDRVALALGVNEFGYPAFGPKLERRVDLVPGGSGAEALHADWLLANYHRAQQIDRKCWKIVLTTPDGWKAFRRDAAACGS